MKRVLFLLVLGMICLHSMAVDYYVATTGNDSNEGSLNAPWLTVQKAAIVATAGDRVFIQKGTYIGNVQLAHSGQPGQWLTFDAYPGDEGQVILDKCEFKIVKKSYIRVSGLKVQNGDHGFKIEGPSSNIIISNNHTYNTFGSGIIFWGVPWMSDPGDYNNIQDIKILHNKVEKACNGGWNECITLVNGIVDFEIAYNEVFNGGDPINGGEGIDIKAGLKNGSIHDNYVHGLTRRGIYLDGAGILQYPKPIIQDVDVYNNTVHNCVGQGVAIMTEGIGDVHSIKVYNNVLYSNTEDGIMIYKHPNGSGNVFDCLLINNTIWNNTRFGILVNFDGATNLDVQNNICYQNGTDYRRSAGGGTESTNLISVNPKFISISNYDFKLQSTSVAINRGSSSNAPQYDKDGVLRDNKVDIGAYEYSNVTSSHDQVGLSDDIFIYPNPADDKIRVSCNGFMNQDVNYSIFGLKGEIRQSGKLKLDLNSEVQIDLQSYSSGTYLFVLSTPNRRLSKLLLVSRR